MHFQSWILLLCWCAFVTNAGETNAPVRILFQETFDPPTTGRWEQVKFDDLTDYKIVTENSNACLLGIANGTASAFSTKLELRPASAMSFSWRWKIDRCPDNGTDDKAKTFDHSGRVFVAFDTFVGPPRVINYVWANHVATKAIFDHPLTSRAKFIAVRSGNTQAGKWLNEERDLTEDWRKLFPREKMPKIVGIGVFTDSDGTKVPITGWYDDILLKGR
jgi:hypothetical protein